MADLISLARVRQTLPELTHETDALVSTLIAAATRAIERRTRRNFATAAYDEVASADGTGRLQLRQFPVVAVQRVSHAPSTAISVSNTDQATNQLATVAVTATGLTLERHASGVTITDTSIAWSSAATVEEVADAVTALGSGWFGETSERFLLWPSAELVPVQGAVDCLGRSAPIRLFAETLDDFQLDASAGALYAGLPAGRNNVRVQYTAGFNVVPDDVQEACTQLVIYWLRQAERDASLRKETLGDYSYERLDNRLDVPAGVDRLLAPYRDLAL